MKAEENEIDFNGFNKIKVILLANILKIFFTFFLWLPCNQIHLFALKNFLLLLSAIWFGLVWLFSEETRDWRNISWFASTFPYLGSEEWESVSTILYVNFSLWRVLFCREYRWTGMDNFIDRWGCCIAMPINRGQQTLC